MVLPERVLLEEFHRWMPSYKLPLAVLPVSVLLEESITKNPKPFELAVLSVSVMLEEDSLREMPYRKSVTTQFLMVSQERPPTRMP
jgi:hypothetical protein